jgi:hypothetical protein
LLNIFVRTCFYQWILDPVDPEKRRLLELQYESISQDISMMASDWQLGKTALNRVFEPPEALPAQGSDSPSGSSYLKGGYGLGLDTLEGRESTTMGPVVDSMETLEDQQRLMALAAKREETWEASTESGPSSLLSRRLDGDGLPTARMTRAERIAHQKLLREQEEAKRERIYDNTKMVHELKDVLGRRRHLRENDDEPEPASGSSSRVLEGQVEAESLGYSIVAGSLAEQLARATAEGEQQQLSLAEEFSASLTSKRIPTFSLNESVFTSGSDSFMSFMESSIEPMEESIVEITGVGEADEEEEGQQDEEEEAQGTENVQVPEI